MPTQKTIIGWSLAGATLAGLLFVPVQTLEVRSRKADRVILREMTAAGDLFTFSYIHSIENIPVEGVFAVEGDGAIRVVETRYPSYGAGLSTQVTRKSDDARWLVAQSEQRLPEFSFYISPMNRSTLRIGDNILDLNRLIESGDIVTVAVRRYPRFLVRWGLNK
jgi:hypothetical protein